MDLPERKIGIIATKDSIETESDFREPLLLPFWTKSRELIGLAHGSEATAQRLKFFRSWRPKWWMGVPAGLVLSLALLIFWVLGHPLAKTSIAGTDFNESTPDSSLYAALSSQVKAYKLVLQYPDNSKKSFMPEEAGIQVNMDASVKSAREVRRHMDLFSRFMWWQKKELPLQFSTDQQQLNAFVNSKATQATKPPRNAVLAIENGATKIVPETIGEGTIIKDAYASITSAIAHLKLRPLVLEKAKLYPAIVAGNLTSSRQQADKILKQTITFTIDGQRVTAASKDIANWIELTPVEADKTVDVNINSGKVLEYINAIAKPYVQPPRSQIVMTQADGSTVIISPGHSGVDVENKEDVAAATAKKAADGSGGEVTLPVKYATFKTISSPAYDKWIVVDVTTKRMYAYEQTELVHTFLVSAGAPQTPTVLGEYRIYSKIRKQDMRGRNADGSRYFQPNVEWVNYFYQDYAIHGNYWRPSSYFGNINSSHGCVGVVNGDAQWVYNWAPIGTPVLVHK
jgi:lipoprotein-anchoring transpeptidase ErfK/SrfK